MLSNCHVLNGLYYHQNLDFKFKSQRIVDSEKNVIGVEILLDFEAAAFTGRTQEYQDAIHFGGALFPGINRVIRLLDDKWCSGETNQKLFINVERSNLCDVRALSSIVELSIFLFQQSIDLIVEITERNPCGRCVRVLEGINYLRNAGICLAVDDYDYVDGDFREVELHCGLYEFVKVNLPKNDEEKRKLNFFIESSIATNKLKLIIERVETLDEFSSLPAESIYGFQGFLFCKGLPLS